MDENKDKKSIASIVGEKKIKNTPDSIQFRLKKQLPMECWEKLALVIFDRDSTLCKVSYEQRIKALAAFGGGWQGGNQPKSLLANELGAVLKASGLSLLDFFKIIGCNEKLLRWPDTQTEKFCDYLIDLIECVDMKALGDYAHSLLAEHWKEIDKPGSYGKGPYYARFILCRTDIFQTEKDNRDKLEQLQPDEIKVLHNASNKTFQFSIQYYPAFAYLYNLPLHWLSGVADDVLLFSPTPEIERIMDCYCRLNKNHRDYLDVLVTDLLRDCGKLEEKTE